MATAADLAMCFSGSTAPSCWSGQRAAAGTLAVPAAPGNLTASAAGDVVTLSWTAPADASAVTAYTIEVGSAPGLTNLANFSTGSPTPGFQAAGVAAGTYYVRVRAQNASGVGDPSNEATLTVGTAMPCVAPGVPGTLQVTTNSGGTVAFAWGPASGSPTSYVLEAGSASGQANLANTDLGSPVLSTSATGVGAGTYYVRVRARNACGTSGPSNEVVLTVGGTSSCGANLPSSAFAIDDGTWVGTVPVGPSAGAVLTFTIGYATIGAVSFNSGTWVGSDGSSGRTNGGGVAGVTYTPRVVFSFRPTGGSNASSVVFAGNASSCAGGKVTVLTGNAYPGYIGTLACQPGETCNTDWGTHYTGNGLPMTLTRQ